MIGPSGFILGPVGEVMFDLIPDDSATPDPSARYSKIRDFLVPAVNLTLGVGVGVTMIAIIVSGIKFVISKGDIKAVDNARKSLTYSVVAMLLVLGAWALLSLILGTLNISLSSVNVTSPDVLPDF